MLLPTVKLRKLLSWVLRSHCQLLYSASDERKLTTENIALLKSLVILWDVQHTKDELVHLWSNHTTSVVHGSIKKWNYRGQFSSSFTYCPWTNTDKYVHWKKKKEKLFFGGEGDIQEVISSHKCYMKSTNTWQCETWYLICT